MKKLMIAAAMVCAAAMSYGASCQWNISGSGALTAPSGVTFASGALSSPMMYIFESTASGTALNTVRLKGSDPSVYVRMNMSRQTRA